MKCTSLLFIPYDKHDKCSALILFKELLSSMIINSIICKNCVDNVL